MFVLGFYKSYSIALIYFIFFFKQKTAYEIKECDWSSDVCSSDLAPTSRNWHGNIPKDLLGPRAETWALSLKDAWCLPLKKRLSHLSRAKYPAS